MPARPQPRLQAFPAEDLAFRQYVAASLGAVLDRAHAGGDIPLEPEDLQLLLRRRYPAAVVRPRDALADPGEGELVWYVYRFGSIPPGIRWWEEPGHAWAILDDERRFAEVSTSLTEIVQMPRDALLGVGVEALANPADMSARDDIRAMWDELHARGEIHATLRFRREDGTEREIEYHVTSDGAGPQRHLAVVREIAPRPVG